MSDITHFRAWLVNDPLDQENCDIFILEDKCIGEPGDECSWSTDTTKNPAFYALAAVNAKDGAIEDACREAERVMRLAGWQTVGDWETTANAYTATVVRV